MFGLTFVVVAKWLNLGACLLGVARALIKDDESYESKLRELGLLTRDHV